MKDKIVNVSSWEEMMEEAPGTKDKKNIYEPRTKEKYMIKYPTETTDGKILGENWAEKLATEIGKIIGIPVQESFLATKEEKQGVLIKYSLKEHEILEQASILLKASFPDFIVDKPIFYTFNSIEYCIKGKGLKEERKILEDFYKMIFFDAVIGNTDRHCENWGLAKNYKNKTNRLIEAYDNSSSLGRDKNTGHKLPKTEDEIKRYARKAKSSIRVNEKERIDHYSVLRTILEDYPEKKDTFRDMIEKLTDDKVNCIINNIPEDFMEEKIKDFVKKLIKERINQIKEILNE